MTPTISDRDFVIATVAAPTVVKEPEKPAAEGETVEGAEGETAEGGEAAPQTKEGEQAKKDEKSKDASAEKKPVEKKLQTRKHLKRNNFICFY